MTRLIAAALCLAPAALSAQDLSGIYVSDPDACRFAMEVDAEEGPSRIIGEGGATILVPWGLHADELSCEWDEDILFDWSEERSQIRPGFCVSSEHVMPTIFVIQSYPDLRGELVVWQQGVDAPQTFASCAS